MADTDPSDEWLPLDANPHADDKRDVLDPSGEGLPFRRVIQVALGVGVLAVILVIVVVAL